MKYFIWLNVEEGRNFNEEKVLVYFIYSNNFLCDI